jgi:hypothetical protein
VKGIDRLVLTEKKYGKRGRKVVIEFLDHFASFCTIPRVHVVMCMSDQFWFNYWIQHPKLSMRGHAVYVPPASEEDLCRVWRCRIEGVRDTQGRALGVAEDVIRAIVQTWGHEAHDISRVLAALQGGLVPSVCALAKDDVRAYVMAWLNTNAALLRSCSKGCQLALAEDANADDDKEENGEGERGQLDLSRDVSSGHVRLLRLIASSSSGSLGVSHLLQQPDGHLLLTYALAYTMQGSNSLLTLRMASSDTSASIVPGSLVSGTARDISSGSQETASACLVGANHLASLGLCFEVRRPLQRVAMQYITAEALIANSPTGTGYPESS